MKKLIKIVRYFINLKANRKLIDEIEINELYAKAYYVRQHDVFMHNNYLLKSLNRHIQRMINKDVDGVIVSKAMMERIFNTPLHKEE